MDGAQKEITLRRATVAEVVPLIGMAEPFNTDAEPFDAARIAAQGARFVFDENGKPACGFVLALSESEVFIMAAGSVGSIDYTKVGLAAIEGMARGQFDTVAFATRRGGLIRKARRLGYHIDGDADGGKILRKRIT